MAARAVGRGGVPSGAANGRQGLSCPRGWGVPVPMPSCRASQPEGARGYGAGLLEMRRAGAVTMVESEETAVASGMPRAAKEMGAACREAPLGEIAHEVLAVI